MLEIEVKFNLKNSETIRSRILDIGGISKGRIFEKNFMYDDRQKSLCNQSSLLRLRQDEKSRLTYKCRVPNENSEFKVRQELEVEVSDFKIMDNILNSLGFRQEQVYEKWRETLILDSTLFCIDTMPYGIFLEIEGEEKAILKAASDLGLKWETRIIAGYLSIFSMIKQDLNLDFFDLTFENFKNVHVDFDKYLPLLTPAE